MNQGKSESLQGGTSKLYLERNKNHHMQIMLMNITGITIKRKRGWAN